MWWYEVRDYVHSASNKALLTIFTRYIMFQNNGLRSVTLSSPSSQTDKDQSTVLVGWESWFISKLSQSLDFNIMVFILMATILQGVSYKLWCFFGGKAKKNGWVPILLSSKISKILHLRNLLFLWLNWAKIQKRLQNEAPRLPDLRCI